LCQPLSANGGQADPDWTNDYDLASVLCVFAALSGERRARSVELALSSVLRQSLLVALYRPTNGGQADPEWANGDDSVCSLQRSSVYKQATCSCSAHSNL